MTDLHCTQSTRAALDEALDDEYRSRATYRAVLEAFGPVRPFVNIVEAEQRHIDALLRQYERLALPVPADPWGGRIDAPADLEAACRAGVEAELANAELYDRLLTMTEDPQVRHVFGNLQRASQERHLPAFQRCSERGGAGGGGPGPGRGGGRGGGRGPGRRGR